MEGWIKLHRKILENPVVCKDADHLAVWIYLLLKATHDDYPVLFKGHKTILKPGQLITGRKIISGEMHISESKVQRILKTLEIEQQIEQQTSNSNRLVTILNWEKYQNSEQQTEQPVNNHRTTSEQPVNTNKNKRIKEQKNIKEKEIVRFAPPTLEQAKQYCIERKNSIDAEKFVDFYESTGWMVGKNKMKDWKAAVRNWERGEKKETMPQKAKANSFHNFEQRTYNYADLEQKFIEKVNGIKSE